MSNLKILLKNNINCMFGVLQGKKARKKAGAVIAFCTLAIVGICTLFGLEVFGLFKQMGKVGLGEIPMFNSVQIMLTIVLLIAFQNLSGRSKTKDSDFLMSLPVSKIEIILSKTLSKYLFNLFIISMVYLPSVVLYSIYIKFSISVILWGIYILLILPFLGIGVNYILEFLIIKLFNRVKFANALKTIFAILLYGVLIGVYIYNATVMGTKTIETIDAFLNTNFFAGWCVKLMCRNNVLCLLFITLICMFVFAVGVALYSLVFGKTYSKYSSKNKNINFSSACKTSGLIKKELKTYFATPIYMINTLISPIIMVALCIFLGIKGRAGLSKLFGFGISDNLIFSIIILMFLFFSAMTQISPCSISMEGKFLWVLKSSPVSERKVLLSKSFVNMFVFVPFHLICSCVLCSVLKAGIHAWVFMLLLPLLLNLTISFGGVYINLLMPKLDWENEAQVVKSSASVFVSMIFGFVLCAVPVILNVCSVGFMLNGYITLGVYLLTTLASIVVLLTDGVKKFRKLQA